MNKHIIFLLFLFGCLQGLRPQAGKTLFESAYHKQEINDLRGALDDYTKSLALEPELAEAYYNRAHVKYDLGDHSGAIDDMQKAILLKPKIAAGGYADLGLYYYVSGNDAEAIKACDRSLELNPNQVEALINRALAKLALGMDHCDDIRRARILDPVMVKKYYKGTCP